MNYPCAALTLTLGKINLEIFYMPVPALLYQRLPCCCSLPANRRSLTAVSVALRLSLRTWHCLEHGESSAPRQELVGRFPKLGISWGKGLLSGLVLLGASRLLAWDPVAWLDNPRVGFVPKRRAAPAAWGSSGGDPVEARHPHRACCLLAREGWLLLLS